MKKIFLKIFLILIFCKIAFASQSLDDAINQAAGDIAKKCSSKSILVIDDFKSPSSKMTLYLREQIADLIFSKNSRVQIVTREMMNIVEKIMKIL